MLAQSIDDVPAAHKGDGVAVFADLFLHLPVEVRGRDEDTEGAVPQTGDEARDLSDPRVPCMIEICPDSSGEAEGGEGPVAVAGGMA
ncbi:hypothetical protein GCM10023079_22410 [Streptomyces chitinivorans]